MPETTDKIDSKFRFILLAAKRARQLQGGARPLIHTTARKPTRVAQEELKAGAVQFEYLPGSHPESISKEETPVEKSDE